MKFSSKLTIYDKYMFKQVLFATVAAILLFTVVWIAPEMLLNTIKATISGRYTPQVACWILLLELPKILGKAFPIGLLLGALFTFDKLSKDSEITIFRAIGLSFWRIIAPVIVLSLIVTGLCFITYDKLIPFAENKSTEIEQSYPNIQYMYTQKNESNQPTLAVVVSNYSRGQMNDIIVLDFSKKIYDDLQALTNIYVAKTGVTYDDHWELKDVSTYEISDDGLFINIEKKKNMNILEGKEAKNATMLMTYSVKRDRELTNKELLSYIKLLKAESLDEEYNSKLNSYLQRFLHPFVCVLLAIMGCLLGFSKPREQRLIGFTIAISCTFLYYITLPFFDLLAAKGVLHPLITASLPPMAFTFAIYMFYNSKDL